MTPLSTPGPTTRSAHSMYQDGSTAPDDRKAYCALFLVFLGIVSILSAGVASFLTSKILLDHISVLGVQGFFKNKLFCCLIFCEEI